MVVCLFVDYEDGFSKMICSSRGASHPKLDLNSHLDEQMGNCLSRGNLTIKRSDEFWEIFLESEGGGREDSCEEKNEKSKKNKS